MSVIGEIGDTAQISGLFEWKISNFLSLSDKVGDNYFSPNFYFNNKEWYLKLYVNGKTDESQGWIALCLLRDESGPPETVNYRFGIKGSNGVEVIKELQHEFSKYKYSYGCSDFLSRSELSDRKSILLSNNDLTIVCDLRSGTFKNDTPPARADQAIQAVLDETPPVPVSDRDQVVVLGEKKCQKSLLSLLESGDDSDVVIKVQGKDFPAHRNILRARSDVFHSMFAHDMVEKNSGVVKVEDCDPTVFPDFLIHIYSGRCDHISAKNVCGLYTAADKYDFADLKQACSDFMNSHIDVGCFCDILALAMKYNVKDLTECATNFFCDNTIEIAKTTEWQIFLEENSTVGNELFLKAVSNYVTLLNTSKK